MPKTKYKVGGMSCAACVARVEKAVGSLSGVESCEVNLLLGLMTVTGEVDSTASKRLILDKKFIILNPPYLAKKFRMIPPAITDAI